MPQQSNNQQQQQQQQDTSTDSSQQTGRLSRPNMNVFQRAFAKMGGPPAANKQQQQRQPNTQQRQQRQQENFEDTDTNTDTKKAKSPLDDFTDLFQTTDDEGQPAKAPSLSLDPTKLQEHVAKMDFTSDLPQDMQLALANMPGDVGKHFMAALNHVGRKAYSSAVHHNSVLTDTGINKRLEFEGQQLDGRVRSHLVKNQFNDASAHPVAKAMHSMMGDMIAQRYPDATPEWIKEQTTSFFSAMSGQDPNQKGSGRDANTAEDVNWLDFVEGKPQQVEQ